ncbi:MAG: zinc ribbon domain-containing protein [Syntrophales bacterium]|nr:zinc ribbon domain-containing protein [Syntrophales bacterium]
MPIYEFLCTQCNTIFNFFSKRVNTDKIPMCPKCKNVALKRQVSLFAKISRISKESEDVPDTPPIDEERMEKAIEAIASEVEHVDDEDPRRAASLMRKLSEAAGMRFGPAMEEAIRRLELGEDPEKIEEEMGSLLEEEEPLLFTTQSPKLGKRQKKPKVDETIYEL